MTHTPSQMPDVIYVTDVGYTGGKFQLYHSGRNETAYTRSDLAGTRAASAVPSDKERALTAPDQTETIKALVEALENTTIVELPSETESYKYKVPMAMIPMDDWERVEKALALAKKAGA